MARPSPSERNKQNETCHAPRATSLSRVIQPPEKIPSLYGQIRVAVEKCNEAHCRVGCRVILFPHITKILERNLSIPWCTIKEGIMPYLLDRQEFSALKLIPQHLLDKGNYKENPCPKGMANSNEIKKSHPPPPPVVWSQHPNPKGLQVFIFPIPSYLDL